VDHVEVFDGVSVLVCDADGPPLASETDATDLVGAAFGHDVDMLAVPVERLSSDFFVLRTRVAGDIVQKFVNYRIRFVVIGDVSALAAESESLRDFVAEANRGTQIWFVADEAELSRRLSALA
jgi:Domain of unknown function (DUF4180)